MAKDEDFKLLKIQTCTLRVNLHCDGCKHQVKKVLQRIEGVYQVSIDAEQQKVTVLGSVDASALIKKLVKAGKHAEIWSNKSNNHQSQSQNQKGLSKKDDKNKKGHETLKKQQKVKPLTSGEEDDDVSFEDNEDLSQKQQEAVSANNPKKIKNKSQPNSGNGKKSQNVVGGQKGNFEGLSEGKRVILGPLGGGGGGNLGGFDFEMANGGQHGQHMMMNMNGLRYNQQQQGYNLQQQQMFNQSAAGSLNMMSMQNRQAMYQRPTIMQPTTGYYYNYNPAPYPYNEPPYGCYYTGGNGGGDVNMWSDEDTSSCSVM
ncbi:putative heavy metal-associated domain, HMA, heavy metal-associated domain superfamily [Helianthus annuus]|uniref:Heavy metal-associated domain, HMA, heavy metal-associated domain superfamily n=1 Tax=Helianthus annuus TaxID=4232 RepID=A0A9K3GVK6_HELAN|nr:heavy metal-associated isoprenylated plant protein 37-like [Helianthus annuus]KAF5757467.1 putative heavy metal-associated domain, HMA, heavy metal-associated domain superfamily [Helianthus annuus]KAJ0435871.1 putative heavy metal-associated domain, HMA, heavy metal-associated domain superfamily [Helianthus annuus]